ncbi:MAG: ATP-binding cassette domain-containing protein [Lachnospiraceae bacterium]|nr:ATP-binding cassette domain-containing protein [Lachnospiraceae bacterium]
MIEFEHVNKSYPDTGTTVFKNFSEIIERGEFAVLTGESGSGKTTLIKMLLQDTLPDSGIIRVNGQDTSTLKKKDIPAYRRNFGVVFQDFRLIADRTVSENIKLAMIVTGAPMGDVTTKVWNVAKLLRITEILKKFPKEISGGEQQKVCLARAIINNPPILLADEPTSNLDPNYSREMMRLFEVIHGMGTTVLIATQDPIIGESELVRNIHLRSHKKQTQ